MSKKNACQLLVILILSFFVSCQQKDDAVKLEKGTVYIGGFVKGHESHAGVISLIVQNELYDQYNSIILDQDGYFSFQLELLHPQDVQLFYEKGRVQLFVKQGDSLHFTLEAEKFKTERSPHFELSGNNAETTKQIWNYRQFRENDMIFTEPSKYSVPEYLSKLEHLIYLEDSVLTSYINTYKPGHDFIVWAKEYFRYQYANHLIDYSRAHPEMNYDNYTQLFDNALFPIYNDNAILTSEFSVHLRHYFLFMFLKDSAVVRLSKTGKKVEAYELALSKSLQTVQKGLFRDVMLFATLRTVSDYDYQAFVSLAPLYHANIDNPYIKDMLAALTEAHPLSTASLTSDSLWTKLTNEYKNKVVFVSFWATWCGPCKTELPFIKLVEQAYREKEVQFIHICMSSNQASWETLKKDIPGEHFFLTKEQGELLRSKLKINGYPTYMLIDKEGNPTQKQALRPSQTAGLMDQINMLLKD